MNRESRNMLIACIIGDGYLNKNGYGTIVHSTKNEDYLIWKRNRLISNGIPVGKIAYFNNNGFPGAKLYISASKWGKLLHKIMYTPKKNYFNRKILNRLTAEHVAIWFMDDGGLSQKKRDGKIVANDLMLNTHTSKKNNEILIKYFYEVWGIKFTQVLNKGHYRLRCGTKEARKFISLVKPFVSQVPSMWHKINVKEESTFKRMEAPCPINIGDDIV